MSEKNTPASFSVLSARKYARPVESDLAYIGERCNAANFWVQNYLNFSSTCNPLHRALLTGRGGGFAVLKSASYELSAASRRAIYIYIVSQFCFECLQQSGCSARPLALHGGLMSLHVSAVCQLARPMRCHWMASTSRQGGGCWPCSMKAVWS